MWNYLSHRGNTAIITDDGCCLTYEQLHIMQQKFLEALDKPELVCIFCSNTVESLVAYTACIEAHIPVMLEDAGLTEGQKTALLDAFEPDYIYEPDDTGTYRLRQVQEQIPVGSGKNHNKSDVRGHKKDIHPELALLLSTSGTTGSPKHVRISYLNLLANTQSIIQALGIKENDRTITSMDMSYSFGLSIINTYLYAGASIVLTKKKVYSPAFWRLVEELQVTSFSGVPAVYGLFYRFGIEKYDLAHLRVMTQAGGGMEPELWEYMEQFAKSRGIEFYVMYGQTEATARIACLQPDMMDRKRGSIGQAVSGGRLVPADEIGVGIEEPGVEGELVYYGENVSMGYAVNREDLAGGNERQGRLATGDYGYFDEDGYWYVTGRKDRMWKLSGKRYPLDEMEGELNKKFAAEFRCFAEKDLLCVQGMAEEEEVKRCIRERFQIHPVQVKYRKGKVNVVSKNKIR